MIGKKFVFVDTNIQKNQIYFNYKIFTDEKIFDLTEKIIFPVEIYKCVENKKLVRALHFALGISYYKSFIPPIIEHPYEISDLEAEFWNIVFSNGLGEFLYKNNLSIQQLAKFTKQNGLSVSIDENVTLNDSALLGIGGGKDSIVAGELLKEIGVNVEGFVLATNENNGQTQSVANVMGIELSTINRILDNQIFELNQQKGSYNGHVPVSLIFALCGCILAVSKRKKYVVVGNESSSSIPQLRYEDLNVNHQWSKSLDFERLFQDYLRAYVSADLMYFSAIRPLSSIAVAKIFSNYPKYFEVFSSDNSLLKIKPETRDHPRWSRSSSKSLSSFILLAPWLTDEKLLKTFGENFLFNSDLKKMLSALLGQDGQKVLDCVGTSEELRSSLAELVRQKRYENSELIKYARESNLLKNTSDINSFLNLGPDSIPEELSETLKNLMEEKT